MKFGKFLGYHTVELQYPRVSITIPRADLRGAKSLIDIAIPDPLYHDIPGSFN